MPRITSALVLGASLFAASPAFAVDHFVRLMGDGFFPDVVYIEPGDRVRFINTTDSDITAVAADGSWTSGVIAGGEAVNMNIVPGMHQVFHAEGAPGVTGTVFFGQAPLNN